MCKPRYRLRAPLLPVLLAALGAGNAFGAELLPDPTRPATFGAAPRAAAKAPSYSVSSVVIGSDRRLAVVNGKTVSEGDRVDGARVVAVLAGGVRLQRGGREFTVELLPRRFKRRSATGN